MSLPSLDAAIPPPQGAVRLTDWGVIRAAGADSRKFLHGQLTQDVELMATHDVRLAGYCSAKGRLLATFVMWRDGADDMLLACSADVLPAVLKRLSMFVLRAQCKLSDATVECPLWGLAGAALVPGLPTAAWSREDLPGGTALRLPDAACNGTHVPRWLWAGEAPAASTALPLDVWQGLEASSGVARVVAATVEQFVPQMVNLELVGGVNFQKGCYPGQEIVARSQYRGTLKRRAQVVVSASPLHPGLEIFHDGDPGQPAGMVVLSGALPGLGTVALVELKLATLLGGTLHAGSTDGPVLTLNTLPYTIPLDPA
jgi:folate-binding protein YgfZ